MSPGKLSSSLLPVALVVSSLFASRAALAALSKTGDSDAGFLARGPIGMHVDGHTSELLIADDGATVVVTVPLGQIRTGIPLRDKHARGYLEVDKFPDAVLKVARGSLRFPAPGDRFSGDSKGTLTVHGVTREVTFHYDVSRDGDVYSVKGKAHININDYGVKTPGYLGVTVNPEMDVFARFTAKDS